MQIRCDLNFWSFILMTFRDYWAHAHFQFVYFSKALETKTLIVNIFEWKPKSNESAKDFYAGGKTQLLCEILTNLFTLFNQRLSKALIISGLAVYTTRERNILQIWKQCFFPFFLYKNKLRKQMTRDHEIDATQVYSIQWLKPFVLSKEEKKNKKDDHYQRAQSETHYEIKTVKVNAHIILDFFFPFPFVYVLKCT